MESQIPSKPRSVDGKLRDADDLGAIIRRRRQELGLTQAQLAQSCKCSPSSLASLSVASLVVISSKSSACVARWG